MTQRARHIVAVTAVLALTALGGTAFAPAAAAQPVSHPAVVSENPAGFTPGVQDDTQTPDATVNALLQRGSAMYAGGRFHTVTNSARTTTSQRDNLMAFDARTGALAPFAPAIGSTGGVVWALAASGPSLYVGGDFGTVAGKPHRALVKLDAVTGAVDPGFSAPIPSGRVTELALTGNRLLVAGSFPKHLIALDPATGSDTGYLNLGVSGSVATDSRPSEVYKFAVNPAGTRLMAIGNFTTVSGQSRPRAAMVDLGATATLDAWRYPPMASRCAGSTLADQLRDVDFSPDGSYFVIVASGFVVANSSQLGFTVCDAAARFDTANRAPSRPVWINYTGGDTLHSVAISGAAVYVQGHQRWLDNPKGKDSAGPGAVARQGIGAIDPKTGKALPWNPSKDRDVGGKDFLVTPAGLWVASDGRLFHGQPHWGIAFCPL
jgi:hypothetical protein